MNASPHLEIGIRSGERFTTTCSGENGNFMVFKLSTITLDWENAEVRIRNEYGEVRATNCTPDPDCNKCHYLTPPMPPADWTPVGGEGGGAGAEN